GLSQSTLYRPAGHLHRAVPFHRPPVLLNDGQRIRLPTPVRGCHLPRIAIPIGAGALYPSLGLMLRPEFGALAMSAPASPWSRIPCSCDVRCLHHSADCAASTQRVSALCW